MKNLSNVQLMHQNKAIFLVPVSLLLTLKIFYTLLWFFYFNYEQVNADSHPEVFFKKGVRRVFRHFTGEHSLKSCDLNFLETTLLHGYFSVNMLHICSRTPFLKNTSEELLLYIVLNIEVINCAGSL